MDDAAELLAQAAVRVRASRAYAKAGKGEDSQRCHAEAVALALRGLALLQPEVIECSEPLSPEQVAEIAERWRAQHA